MKRDINYNFIQNNDFDSDFLRNLFLNEERFLKDIVYEDTMEEFDLEFDFEDYYIQLRDEQLIEEREAYEREYFSIPDEIQKYDLLDLQIDSFEEYNYCPEYDYYEDCFPDYDYYENCYPDYDCIDDYYVEEINMDAAYCGGSLFGYVVDDNECFSEFDYPEGPDENLGGFRYPELEHIYNQCPDFPDDFYYCPEPEYVMDEPISLDLYLIQESKMQNLIDHHLKEEEQFMKFIANGDIPDEYLPPELLEDEIILLN